MTRTRDFLRWFARSSLGIALVLCSAVVGLALFMGGMGLSIAVLAAAVFFVAASVVAFVSGAGGKAAAAERQRDEDAALDARLESAARMGERVAALRIPDKDVRTATEAFALAFGDYLNACRRERSRDPQADETVEDVLSALSGFLKELDGTAIERRFDLPDADPFPDAKERTISYLNERTAFVRSRRLLIEGGLGGGDRLSVKEDLR